MKKHLVIGGSSFIGNSLINYLKKKGLQIEATNSDGRDGHIQFNLLNPTSILEKIKFDTIDTIFLPAAISSPDTCRNKYDYALKINVDNTSKLISIFLDYGIKVIFFSSDTVYGEQKEKFDESIDCNPIGEYAFMKHSVEKKFEKNHKFKAIRLSYVFSKNDKFTRYLLHVEKQNDIAEIFHPFCRSVIHLEDVLEGLYKMSESWDEIEHTFVNFGGQENISRLYFAKILKEGRLKNLKFVEKSPDKLFFKSRAKYINMESPILRKILKRQIHTFSMAVEKEFHDES